MWYPVTLRVNSDVSLRYDPEADKWEIGPAECQPPVPVSATVVYALVGAIEAGKITGAASQAQKPAKVLITCDCDEDDECPQENTVWDGPCQIWVRQEGGAREAKAAAEAELEAMDKRRQNAKERGDEILGRLGRDVDEVLKPADDEER